jgi:hypothetical protein
LYDIMPSQISANDFKTIGFGLRKNETWRRRKGEQQTRLFRGIYGASPTTCECIWRDFDDAHADPVAFLVTLCWMKGYETEEKLAIDFEIPEKTIRDWCKIYATRIQFLKATKIDANWKPDGFIFFLSIDGTHCPINEPRPFSTTWSSHKFGGAAGVDYEIGLRVHESKVAWISGPYPAGTNDLTVFKDNLMNLLPNGKRVIADDAYSSAVDYASCRNEFDPPEIAYFKERVMARHESFNSRLKKFKCFVQKWRHDLSLHKIVFEAVCVTEQYQMEHGKPLLDPFP